jgi:hypothetical protein
VSYHSRKLVILRCEWQSVLVFILPLILSLFVKNVNNQEPASEENAAAAADLGRAHLAIPSRVDTTPPEDTAAAAAELGSAHLEISSPVDVTGTDEKIESARKAAEEEQMKEAVERKAKEEKRKRLEGKSNSPRWGVDNLAHRSPLSLCRPVRGRSCSRPLTVLLSQK